MELAELRLDRQRKDAEIARLRDALEWLLSTVDRQTGSMSRFHAAKDKARAALAQVAEVGMASEWLPIESAPKDGSELIGWRDDAGVLLIRWTCCADFMSDREIEDATKGHGGDSEWIEQYNWFYADFISGGRLEGDEEPTHWMPLPEPPK